MVFSFLCTDADAVLFSVITFSNVVRLLSWKCWGILPYMSYCLDLWRENLSGGEIVISLWVFVMISKRSSTDRQCHCLWTRDCIMTLHYASLKFFFGKGLGYGYSCPLKRTPSFFSVHSLSKLNFLLCQA